MTITTAIERLEALRGKLANTRPFFIDRFAGWVQLAEETARTVLATRVPDGLDPEEWSAQVDYTLSLIGGQILGGEASGILLYLGREQTSLEGFASVVGQVTSGEVTLGDIEAYVSAGLAGDPLGKPDITAEDQGRSAVETAFIIRKAIASGKSQRDEAIAAFINERNRVAVKEFYPAIQAAWFEVFSVVAYEDLRRYVAQVAKEF
jgi:hypothetical protein